VRAFLGEVQAFLGAGLLAQARAGAPPGPGNLLPVSVTQR
jgi:hypothetical protein